LQSDGTYTPNTVRVAASSYYNSIMHSQMETNIFDASFVKLEKLESNLIYKKPFEDRDKSAKSRFFLEETYLISLSFWF
jgi:hypothetical protein